MAPELLALTAAHGGQDLRIFGSVIHEAAGLQSDVDLLVDSPPAPASSSTWTSSWPWKTCRP